MKKRKYRFLLIAAIGAVAMSTAAFVGCGGDDNKPAATKKSGLIGGFESSESRDVILTNDSSLIGLENKDNIPYVYTSDSYPLNTVTDIGLKYNTYQKLRLKRDWTYEYTLEILVRMVSVQSNIDLLKLEATTYGTFEYEDNSNDNYTVTLSDPASGTENRYGSYITGEGNIFSWKLSTSPDYSLNVKSVADDESEFDRYISGKTVVVEKYETERILYNSVFYTDFINDMAEYCSYDSSSAEEPAPVTPPPTVTPDYDPEFIPDVRDVTVLPYKAQNNISLAVGVGSDICVFVKAPSDVQSVKFDAATVTQYDVVGNEHIFAYPVAAARLDQSVSVTVAGNTAAFNPTDYLKSIMGDGSANPTAATAKYLAANLINASAVLGGGQAPSSDVAPYVFNASSAYWTGNNWTRRDNFDNMGGSNADGFEWINPDDYTSGGLKVPSLDVDSNVGQLTYAFAVTGVYTDLGVFASVGGGEAVAIAPTKAAGQPLDGKTVYTFKIDASSPLVFDDVITVEVFNGDKQISFTAGYSVTRALIRIIDHNQSAAGVEKARALYSLGMAATAYGYNDKIQFTDKAPVNAEGRYEFAIGEYAYDIAGAAQTTVAVSGAALYIDGNIISDSTQSEGAEKTFAGDGYTVVRDASGNFTVTLDGAHIDGLYTTNGASLTVIVKSDSYLDMPMHADYTHWVDWNGGMVITEADYGALITRCNLAIKGADGVKAKLTLNGGLSAKGYTVTISDGASVEVKQQSKIGDGVACAVLNVDAKGALSVKYTGAEVNSQFENGMTDKFAVNASSALNVAGGLDAEWSGNAVTSPAVSVKKGATVNVSRVGAEIKDIAGIVSAGNLAFAGDVTVRGFGYGIYLNDTTATQTLTVSGGTLNIAAIGYGINTANVDNGEVFLCRELLFLDGVANITVGEKGIAAISTATVTVDECEVNLTAKHGVGIEARSTAGYWNDWTNEWVSGLGTKIVVNTTSGDHRVGKLSIYAYDGSPAVTFTELNLDGGSVYMYALNTNGVLHTQANAKLTVKNADLVIENGTKLDVEHDSYGRGIKAESGGEVINVTNSGKMIIKNVQVAIESWTSKTELINDGLIILDGFILGLQQWEIDSWDLNITVTGNGQVRQ